MKVAILGDNGVGKSSFVWQMSGLRPPGVTLDEEIIERPLDYPKPLETIVIGGCSRPLTNNHHHHHDHEQPPQSLTDPYFLSLAAVPLEHSSIWLTHHLASCDLIVFMFQCGESETLTTVLELEKRFLPKHIPRVFLGSKIDLFMKDKAAVASSGGNLLSLNSSRTNNNNNSGEVVQAGNTDVLVHDLQREHEEILQQIALHTQETSLPPALFISTFDSTGIQESVQLMQEIFACPEVAIPHSVSKSGPKKDSWYMLR